MVEHKMFLSEKFTNNVTVIVGNLLFQRNKNKTAFRKALFLYFSYQEEVKEGNELSTILE